MNNSRTLSLSTVAMQCYWWLSFAGVAGVVAVPAKADALTAASTFVECGADGNSTFDLTECQVGGRPGIPSSAFASATLSPLPGVFVEVSSPPTGVFGAGASATLGYSFQVTGGNVGDIVPILVE